MSHKKNKISEGTHHSHKKMDLTPEVYEIELQFFNRLEAILGSK